MCFRPSRRRRALLRSDSHSSVASFVPALHRSRARPSRKGPNLHRFMYMSNALMSDSFKRCPSTSKSHVLSTCRTIKGPSTRQVSRLSLDTCSLNGGYGSARIGNAQIGHTSGESFHHRELGLEPLPRPLPLSQAADALGLTSLLQEHATCLVFQSCKPRQVSSSSQAGGAAGKLSVDSLSTATSSETSSSSASGTSMTHLGSNGTSSLPWALNSSRGGSELERVRCSSFCATSMKVFLMRHCTSLPQVSCSRRCMVFKPAAPVI
mmetsp:Transcript_8111/g.19381  ORF Transcript_8111/g.19381 Transcript_8111/m.19381 type:complete len:265 (+) Transcript_8111:323-1117(+)